MEKDLLKFFACFNKQTDQMNLLAICSHQSFFINLNKEFMEQIISLTNKLNCAYYFFHLKTAFDQVLGLLPSDRLDKAGVKRKD